MRHLSVEEIDHVSGAGYVQDLTTYYGSAAGAIIGFSLGALVPIISPLTAATGYFIGAKAGVVVGYISGGITEIALSFLETLFGTST